jgi:hypothetical protein
MTDNKIVEIVEFSAPEGTGAAAVEKGLQVLKLFYQQKDGFSGLKATRDNESRWVLLLDWDSVEAERAASVAMMQSTETVSFKQIVDPKTVSKRLLKLVTL